MIVLMTAIRQTIYKALLIARAVDDETRRRELILNVLLLGAISLSFVAFGLTLLQVLFGQPEAVRSLLVTFVAVCVFSVLLLLSRQRQQVLAMYLFVGIFITLASYPAIVWGVLFPQAILTYSLIIVMSGILLGSRVAFWIAGLTAAILIAVVFLVDAKLIHFDDSWGETPANYKDAITYGVTFLIIGLVSWLSNREIQHSLQRALQSEKELTKERNSLEIKVRERTKALERAQVEKMLDLQRFAEFGRLSATLLHEIANPLTIVSLNLDQLKGKNHSKIITHAREGLLHMEQYVEAARRQLRNQSEIKLFDVASEIERVVGLVEAKARSQQVEIQLELQKGVYIKGDSIRFNHIISNLITNAIDAYEGMVPKGPKKAIIKMDHKKSDMVEIVVQDFGRGISTDQMPHLFEPFYTTKESLRGTGIGLAITKQAVEEAFKGTIEAKCDKKANTTQFIVRLPLA